MIIQERKNELTPEEAGKRIKEEILERARDLTQWPKIIIESEEVEGIILLAGKHKKSPRGTFNQVSPTILLLKEAGIYAITPGARVEIKLEDYLTYRETAMREIKFWQTRFSRLARRT